MSLLKDPEQLEDDQCQDKSEDTSSVKLHKVTKIWSDQHFFLGPVDWLIPSFLMINSQKVVCSKIYVVMKVLWAIHDLDMKWLLLQKRKTALYLCYNRRFEEESQQIYDDTRLNLNQQLIESILESLRVAESEREVDDIDAKFNLHFPPNEVGVDEGQYKRPKRRSLYSECYKAGLLEMASKFGVSPEQLGQQLSLKRMVSLHWLYFLSVPTEMYLLLVLNDRWMHWRIPRKLQRILPQALHVLSLRLPKLFLKGLCTWYMLTFDYRHLCMILFFRLVVMVVFPLFFT